MRLLWMNFCDKNGAGKPAGNIQGETSLLTWSHSDPDTNLLRHTSSMMSAILGGADSILAHPHTLDPALASDAIRQSVNIGHLALEEAHLGEAFDPGSGSYLIEILSHELAQKAWKLFCKWQEMPFVDAVESGFFAKTAEASAEILKEKYASGKLVMTGVNRHPSDLARKSPAFPKQNQSETDFPALKTLLLDA
jgi:methylmalonyl-CoA mutase